MGPNVSTEVEPNCTAIWNLTIVNLFPAIILKAPPWAN